MIEFMILGAPRSGTMWATAWLTTPTTVCYHDPLWDHFVTDLDRISHQRSRVGLSCTALALFPDFINPHPAPKLVLHRPVIEINASLKRCGMPPLDIRILRALDKIEGLHVPWTDLFESGESIYEHLLGPGFDGVRHRALKSINIQEDWKARRSNANPRVLQRLAQLGMVIR